MKFNKVFIPKSITKAVELNEINLTEKPLGRLVALAGKNGAGKSRILDFIKIYPERLTIDNYLNDYVDFNTSNKALINIDQQSLKRLKGINDGIFNEMQLTNVKKDLAQSVLKPYVAELKQHIKVIKNSALVEIKKGLSKEFSLENLMVFPFPKNKEDFNELSVVNSDLTIDFIQDVTQNIILDKLNIMLEEEKQEKIQESKSYEKFEKIKYYIEKFLNKKLSYKGQIVEKNQPLKSDLLIDGVPFDIIHFSPGEKTLFAYAMLFFLLEYASKSSFKDCVIIIDEPELHLHPEAQIKLIEALKNIIGENGQLWIATHSIHILASLNYDEIYLVKNNSIESPGRMVPGKSLDELMGISSIDLVKKFITSTSDWAYANFMSQCFQKPEAVFKTEKNDKQVKIFIQSLKNLKNISILDFGAGKGRIGAVINDNEELKSKIQYYAALEPSDSPYNEELKSVPNIKAIYESLEEIPQNTFDVVLLCNVLHEISPQFWEASFKAIKNSLKQDGFLLIIEDKLIPRGEKANDYGFLLLSEKQINKLFSNEDISHLDYKMDTNKNRILCSLIPKKSITVSNESILAAIKQLEGDSLEELKNLKPENDVAFGREYALKTQLHINAKIGYEKFLLACLKNGKLSSAKIVNIDTINEKNQISMNISVKQKEKFFEIIKNHPVFSLLKDDHHKNENMTEYFTYKIFGDFYLTKEFEKFLKTNNITYIDYKITNI